MTEAIIFRHFATKQQLYAAILDARQSSSTQEWIASVERLMASNDDQGVFRALISAIIGVARNDPQFERLMLYAALEGHELAAMHHQQFAIPIVSLLLDYAARRQGEGAFRMCNPKAILFAMAGMAKQYATHIYLCVNHQAGFSDDEAIETFTQILMGGILAEQTQRSIV